MSISEFDKANVEAILLGHGTWFSADLLRLIAKADAVNLARIEQAFPDHVAAYRAWYCAEDSVEGENPRYGPGNPDWEHDREREDSA